MADTPASSTLVGTAAEGFAGRAGVRAPVLTEDFRGSGETPEYAAVVVGQYGKGRIVAIGPHPLGGGVGIGDRRVGVSGELLDTNRLFVNSLLYAAGLAGREEEPKPTQPSNTADAE